MSKELDSKPVWELKHIGYVKKALKPILNRRTACDGYLLDAASATLTTRSQTFIADEVTQTTVRVAYLTELS